MNFLGAEWAQFMFGAALPVVMGWCGYLTREIDRMKEDNRRQAVILSRVEQKLTDVHELLREVRKEL